MEFGEKLQMLRKSRGLTQEELSERLYVSRTAISKWESGRGYPGIDSLKEISAFFTVSIDDLLSGEKLLSIAQEENKSNIRRLCHLLLGIADIFSLLLIVLPFYPDPAEGYVYSVNLIAYSGTTALNKAVCWSLFLALPVIGLLKIILTRSKIEQYQRAATICSMVLSILAIVFLGMIRQAYAVTFAFMLFVVKGMLVLKISK